MTRIKIVRYLHDAIENNFKKVEHVNAFLNLFIWAKIIKYIRTELK